MTMTTITVKMDTIDLRGADSAPVGGRHVDNLQGLLRGTRDPSFDPGPIDGLGGRRTRDAVVAFQSANHLAADAIVGPLTWGKLIPYFQTSCVPPAVPPPGPGQMSVMVFFTCRQDGDQSPPVPLTRVVPEAPAVLRAALEQELLGPSGEEGAAGFFSWFSGATAGMLRGVELEPAGRAVVDFADLRPVIPGASSSAGSHLLLSQLDATVFQFPNVETVQYRIDGSCDVFFEWLQMQCHDRTRSHRQPA